ncbi:hypothetical protein [Pseudonocardia sp. GCM10023141]|uniref:hypothetical protein n=1 Tax=Pseudonocardia sp. GCM10023141 TaxID=3252653 RepID=UPI003608EDEC
MTNPDQRQRLEDLALELEGPDLPDETYLDAVNRIRGAWTTAQEMIASETSTVEAAEHPTSSPIIDNGQTDNRIV